MTEWDKKDSPGPGKKSHVNLLSGLAFILKGRPLKVLSRRMMWSSLHPEKAPGLQYGAWAGKQVQDMLCHALWGDNICMLWPQEIRKAPRHLHQPILLPSLLDLFKSLFLTHQIHFKFGDKLKSWYNCVCCKADLITVHGSCRSSKKISSKKGFQKKKKSSGQSVISALYLPAVWLWASYLTSKSLQFLICKMGLAIHASQSRWEDYIQWLLPGNTVRCFFPLSHHADSRCEFITRLKLSSTHMSPLSLPW